jgi:hypothetical protein
VKPSVCRAVHYFPEGEEYDSSLPLSATITFVRQISVDTGPDEENCYDVNLHVLRADAMGTFGVQDAPFSPMPKPGHWTWPPRV